MPEHRLEPLVLERLRRFNAEWQLTVAHSALAAEREATARLRLERALGEVCFALGVDGHSKVDLEAGLILTAED